MRIDTLTVGPLETNCYIVYQEGSNQAVVIDPGGNGRRIMEALNGKQAAAVLLTHDPGALHGLLQWLTHSRRLSAQGPCCRAQRAARAPGNPSDRR